MEMKDWISIALSSSAIATLITALLTPLTEWVKRIFEKEKIKSDRKYDEERKLIQKKEEIYLEATNLIRLINLGFYDRTVNRISNIPMGTVALKRAAEQLNDNICEINNLSKTVVPLMKLYATDEIYEKFSELRKYGSFSYSTKSASQSMLYIFEHDFSYMCRKMQENLGIRIDEVMLPIPYMCPKCGMVHDAEEDCPRCGIGWVDAIELEEVFINKVNADKDFRNLWDNCVSEGYDPRNLIVFPLDLDKWKQKMKSIKNAL